MLASCSSLDKVRMVGIGDLMMVGETRFEVTVRIANWNGNNLVIKRAILVLMEDDTQLIEFSLAGKVVISRLSE